MEKMAPDQLENVDVMTKIPPSIQFSNVIKEGTEISRGKLPQMPEKSALMFHDNFYPKPQKGLKCWNIFRD